MTDKIYNEDCLIGMDKIPDGVVDFVLTDLPFGITDCDWDKCIDLAKFWEQIKRVTKHNAAIALFSQLPFAVDLINANRKMFRYEWIVRKDRRMGHLNAKKMPLRCHENILIFYRALPTYNPQFTQGRRYKKRMNEPLRGDHVYNKARLDNAVGLVRENKDGKRYPIDVIDAIYTNSTFQPGTTLWGGKVEDKHPTQKPVDLLEYLIKTYSNEGELVLDATIGSGSTAVACINTNRHFIGFETDEKFYNIANERIRKAFDERSSAFLME